MGSLIVEWVVMFVKMLDNKVLAVTEYTTIYRGECNADAITFLIPLSYQNNYPIDLGEPE